MPRSSSKLTIKKESVRKFLCQREGSGVKIVEFKKLGSGWHGTGYRIGYLVKGKEKKTVLRILSPIGFSHDYSSDRGAVFLFQNKLSGRIPGHIRSIDVGGVTSKNDLVSVGDVEEFFQIVEVADGDPYMNDILRIAKDGKLSTGDIDKAVALSDYLVKLHSVKFKGNAAVQRSLRLRHLRDAIGHGEMLMGVLDTYPDRLTWLSKETIAEVLRRAVSFNIRVRGTAFPLVRMHGDFHPGNIWFDSGRSFTLLDSSREEWGSAADDLTALSINYIWQAIDTTGSFQGPFKKLYDAFWGNYLKKTRDKTVEKLAPLFFAFRGAVVAHPVFYPDQSDSVRKKLFRFILRGLKGEK